VRKGVKESSAQGPGAQVPGEASSQGPGAEVAVGMAGEARRARRMRSRRDRGVITIAALLLCAAPLALAGLGDLREAFASYAVIAVSSCVVLLALHAWLRRRGVELSKTTVVLVAVALRVAAMPMSPTLSDDAWRYLWDGRLVLHGINPYLIAPADPQLERYHDALYGLQGYPTTPTVYPPAAQLFFAAAATPSLLATITPNRMPTWHGVSFLLLKLLLLVLELTAIWSLLALLERLGRPLRDAVLYAWHPLVVIELAGQGHYDGMWIATLGLALVAASSGRKGRGIPWLVAGVLTRLYPLALLPLWTRREGMRRTLVGLALAIPLAIMIAPFADRGALESFVAIVARFTNYYEFNGGAYYLVKWLIDRLSLAPSNVIAGAIGTALQLAVIATATWRLKRGDSLARLIAATLLVVTAIVALGPKAHPWYFVASLFLAALDPRAPLARAWLWVAFVAPLSYVAYAVEGANESAIVLWLEWGGGALIALWSRRREKANRAAGDAGALPASTDRSAM
jgi:alpha-1,6-mannosyltransferase